MTVALILAAGKGTRFQSPFPKQLVLLNGKSILEYSLDIVEVLNDIELTMLVIDPSYEETYRAVAKKYSKKIEFCEGGLTRQESVSNGLKGINELILQKESLKVLIHDSARPFSRKVFQNVLNKLKTEEAVVPVLKTKDTIYVIKDKEVVDIPCRDHLFNVQTPQGFSFSAIFDCHKMADKKKMHTFTDDGSLYSTFRRSQPAIVAGEQLNFKITDKKDMLLGEYYLSKEKKVDKH
ncbi:MAG: IspD/TarI family cytidylyltransferase [Thermotogota bacterium]|nr:IspD/TarI family cytidylyltransferase [Thermotogota bacterium]